MTSTVELLVPGIDGEAWAEVCWVTIAGGVADDHAEKSSPLSAVGW